MRSGARFMINRAAQTLLESMLDSTGNPILKDAGMMILITSYLLIQ